MSTVNTKSPADEEIPRVHDPLYRTLGITCGLAAVLIGILGLAGLLFGIPVLTSVIPGLKPIALSACLGWIILGLVLALFMYRPMKGVIRDTATAVVLIITVASAIELPLNTSGDHLILETFLLQTGNVIFPIPSTPISPLAVALILLSSVTLLLLLICSRVPAYERQIRNDVGMLGIATALVSLTILLSYLYGNPFLYGTVQIPIAITSALAGFFIGAGFIITAGPESFPLSYVTGPSIRAQLLRTFLPLVVIIIFIQNFLDRALLVYPLVENTILVTTILVAFAIITVYVVGKVSTVFSKSLERERLKRRSAEDTERETKEYLENLIHYANAPIIVWNPEFRITEFNHAFEVMTGLSRGEVIDRHLHILFPKETYEASMDRIRSTSAGDMWEVVEIPIRHVSGMVRTVIWNSANVTRPDGAIIATIAQGTDITDRKQAEESLRETNEYLSNLLDYANAPIIVWDTQFRITRFNHAFEHLTGRTEHEVLGQHLEILFPEESKKASLALIKKTLSGERWKVVEIPIVHISGETRIVLWNSANIVDPNGSIISTIAQGQDITERKLTESSLRESEDSYRILASNLPGIVYRIYLRQNNRMIFFNDQLKVLSGYTPDELGEGAFCSIEPFIHPEDLPAVLAAVKKAVTESATFIVDYRFRHKDGSWRYFVERGKVVPGRDLTPLFIDGTIHDITERKLAEKHREALIKELEQKNAELERFTYTVSHDLKSPLITIKGFAGLIEDDVRKGDPVQLKMDIQRILTAADIMQVMLTDLLKLSQVGRIVGPPEKVGFGTLAHDAVNLLAIPLAERGVCVEIAPDLPVVYVDRTRIHEVLVNLIENAINFFGDQQNPVIRIGMEMKGETPVFFVQDNGIGIEKPYLERIFNLFEKLDVNSPGSGIGLTIVRRIIEFHGGKIWAESEGPKKGTTFRFTLPESSDKITDNNNNGEIKE